MLEQNNNYKLKQNFKKLNMVTYGSELQLMHVDSQMFIRGRGLASAAEKSGFAFILSNNFSKSMVFKIHPKYKLR